jgi:hypothetical protein
MITPAKAKFAIVCGFLAGLVFALQAFGWFVVRNAPIVTGRVVSREPTTWLSIPRVDFAIRIDGSDTTVHARTQRGMMNQVPAEVRFHYTGDPARNVILFEQEMNPGWLVLLFWGASLVLAWLIRLPHIRAMLGWT